jgi:hypothetical protein
MGVAEQHHHLRRGAPGVDHPGGSNERVVVLPEVGLAPGEQLGQRQLDHLLVAQ